MEPTLQLSSVVFIGGSFPSTMFNERDFFGGNLDREGQFRAGPTASFRYDSGAYTFELVPERVDLKAFGQELFPEPLLDAARTVAQQLENVRSAVSVSAVGFNCDAVLPRSAIGVDGASFCFGLASKALPGLADAPLAYTYARLGFERGRFAYDVRIEPYHQSQGDDLFVAINATQRVGSSSLDALLDGVGEFEQYVTGFRARLEALDVHRS